MSHFDDVDGAIIMAPISLLGLVIVIVLAVWAYNEDEASKSECARHGESYVDSRSGYTLCEQDGGTVVKR